MAALKDALIEQGPAGVTPIVAGATIPFGAALLRTAAKVFKPTKDDNDFTVAGFSVQPANGVCLDYDGFYVATNKAGVPDGGRMVRKGAVINALVIAESSANTSIEDGDFLECAALGDAGSYIGVLQEAGSNAGEDRTLNSVAQALEDCTITNASYKIPASDVAIGDGTITMAAGAIALMGLKVGEYILLSDINGGTSWNRVKSLTATVITLQFPAATALVHNDSDLVYRVFQVKALVI
jgi:hypothetical protein